MKHAAATLLLACALPAQATDTATLVERLGSSDMRTQSDAYTALQRTRPPDALALIGKRIAGFPISSQSYGMYLIGMYPLDDARPIYKQLMEKGSAFLKGASAANLYRTGDKSVLPVLVAAIGAANEQERTWLFGRLYSIDEPRLAAAVRTLVHTGGDPEAIEQALWHLLSTGKGRDDGAVRAAESLLADAATDARTRAVCAAYLLGTGDGKYTAVLVEALGKDANLLPRLQRFLDRAPRLGPELQDLLVARLQAAKTEYEVTWPCQILRKHDETKAVAALRPLLEHQNEGVRKAALEALAAIPGALQPDALKAMLAAPEPARVLIAADTLRRMDDPSGFERVLELAKNRGPKQADVIRVLGKFRMRAAIPPLLDALADADAAVRREAFTALGRLLVDLFPYRRIDVATSGYQPEGSEDRRAQAVQVLRTWWAALKKT